MPDGLHTERPLANLMLGIRLVFVALMLLGTLWPIPGYDAPIDQVVLTTLVVVPWLVAVLVDLLDRRLVGTPSPAGIVTTTLLDAIPPVLVATVALPLTDYTPIPYGVVLLTAVATLRLGMAGGLGVAVASGAALAASRLAQWPSWVTIESDTLVESAFAVLLLLPLTAFVVGWPERQRRRAAAAVARRNVELEYARQDASRALERLEETNLLLRASNDALERFARTIAHDLRTPLTGVVGFANYLRHAHQDLDDELRLEVLEKIETSALRASEMVSEVLDSARQLESAALQATTVDDVDQWLRELFASGLDGVDLRIQATRDRLDLDVATFRHVMVNTVSNALKYRHATRALEIEVSASRTPGQWVIEVADTGIGVPAGEEGAIFRPGRRGSNAEGIGNGLGLAACRQAVESLGGSILAARRPEGGTIVRFLLPTTDPVGDLAPTASGQEHRGIVRLQPAAGPAPAPGPAGA